MTQQQDSFVRATRSPCPVCRRDLPARIVQRDGDLYMLKSCPGHGDFDLFFWRDAAFYDKIARIAAPANSGALPAELCNRGDFRLMRGVCIDFTQRCNLFCTNCFANANTQPAPDMSLQWHKDKIAAMRGPRKPVIFVQGGEPTLRPDLFEFLEFLNKKGFVAKLVTNGIKLDEPGFIERLKKTGLEWVFLQFDGFTPDASVAFRGRDLIALKLRVLKRLSDHGFKILLACMLENGINSHETGRILDLARATPGVRQIGLLPGSRIGRNHMTGAIQASSAVDVMDWLDRDTRGAVTRNDFLAFHKIAARIYKLTRNPDFRPRTCFFFMMLYHDSRTLLPLNRLLDPVCAARHPRAAAAALRYIKDLRSLDRAAADPNILFITLEKFRGTDTLDIPDAESCVKVHLAPDGAYYPACIYNALHRPQDLNPGSC